MKLHQVMRMARDQDISKEKLAVIVDNMWLKDGGKGSGNFGHKGRPGQIGGSGQGGGTSPESNRKSIQQGIDSFKMQIQTDPKWSHLRGHQYVLGYTTDRPSKQQSKEMQDKRLSNISDKLCAQGKRRFKNMVGKQPKITSDIMDICEQIGSGMYGLPHRLKSAATNNLGVCRIQQKIDEIVNVDKLPQMQACKFISDVVRYTQACTPQNMVDNFNQTRSRLQSKGYKLAKVKNTWDSFNQENAYRGLNTVFVSPDGVPFELQFHTPQSLVTKQNQHGLYQQQRSKLTPPQRKAQLSKQMLQNAKKLTRPVGIQRIKNQKHPEYYV